jgi:uncharacterized membrane protein YqjE
VPGSPPGEGGGVLQSLRNLAATLVELVRTRLELLAAELEEERLRLLQLLLWSAIALFCLGVGLLLLTLLVVVVFWDSHRIAAIAVLAAAYLGAGAALVVGVRNRLQARPRLFSASLGELARDKEQLGS